MEYSQSAIIIGTTKVHWERAGRMWVDGREECALIFLDGLCIGLGHCGRSVRCFAERLRLKSRQIDSLGGRRKNCRGRQRLRRIELSLSRTQGSCCRLSRCPVFGLED